MGMGDVLIRRKSFKTYELSSKFRISSKSMPPYTFSKAFQWAGLQSLPGQFWDPGLMSDIPAVYEHATLNYSNKA